MKRLIGLCAGVLTVSLHAMSPLGLLEPYNFAIKPALQGKKWQITSRVEHGARFTGFNEDGKKVSPLHHIEAEQNVLEFVRGLDAKSGFASQLQALLGAPTIASIDPKAGQYTVRGNFTATQVSLGASYDLGYGFSIQTYIPYISARLSDVSWKYAGEQTFAGAQIEKLFENFVHDSKYFFDLDVQGWKREGFGNCSALLQWERHFPQYRPLLRNVGTTLRVGLTVPTGKKENPLILSGFPFAVGDAIGVPFGGALDLRMLSQLQVGAAAQFWYYASALGTYRLRTSDQQTSLLLPKIGRAIKNYGFTQQFNLYTKVYLWRHVTGSCTYQYTRKSQDILSPVEGAKFDYHTINNAPDLDERSSHYLMFSGMYDTLDSFKSSRVQAGLHVRVPFTGMHSILATTVGLQLAVEF